MQAESKRNAHTERKSAHTIGRGSEEKESVSLATNGNSVFVCLFVGFFGEKCVVGERRAAHETNTSEKRLADSTAQAIYKNIWLFLCVGVTIISYYEPNVYLA